MTALMLASSVGKIAVVEALLRHGADVDAVDIEGSTAVKYACKEDHYDVAKILFSKEGYMSTSVRDRMESDPGRHGNDLNYQRQNSYQQSTEFKEGKFCFLCLSYLQLLGYNWLVLGWLYRAVKLMSYNGL